MKQIYFDQNISDIISKDEDKAILVNNIIENRKKNRKKIQLCITPATLIEYTGAGLKNIFNDKEYQIRKNSTFEDVLKESLDFYTKNIRDDIKEYFLNKLIEKNSYITTPEGKNLIKFYNTYVKTKGFNQEFKQAAILEAVASMNFNIIRDDELYIKLITQVLKVLQKCPQVNMFRYLIKSFKASFKLNKNNFHQTEMKKMQSLIEEHDLKNWKDNIDTEMIHLACFGYNNKAVSIYTRDDFEKVKTRIRFYLDTISFFNGHGFSIPFCKQSEKIICINKKFSTNRNILKCKKIKMKDIFREYKKR